MSGSTLHHLIGVEIKKNYEHSAEFAESRTIESLGKREGFVEAGDRLVEIHAQRLGFCHSGICRCATRRNLSGMRAKSPTSIV